MSNETVNMPAEMTIGKKRFVIAPKDDEIRKTFEKVIEKNEEIRDNVSGAAIEIIFVHPNISKRVIAQAVKSSKELKFFTKRDYLIEFSADFWDLMNDDQKYYVMLHELCHLYKKYNFKTDETSYGLVDHNVKDFAQVITEAGGIHWFQDLKNKMVEKFCNDAKIKDKDDEETVSEKESELKVKQEKYKKSIKI